MAFYIAIWFCYGTHQLQLKRDTRVPRVCRLQNPHALLLHACTFVCFYLLHHEHVRKHELRVHVYTFLYTRARESLCTREIHTATFYSVAS